MEEKDNQQPKEPTKKEKAEQTGKDVAEVAAKGAGAYFGGPAGAAAVDKIAQTKAGQKVLNTAGNALAKNPLTRNALAKAQPAIQKAKPALDMAAGSMGGGASGGATKGMPGASNMPSKSAPKLQHGADSNTTNQTTSNKSSNSGFGNNKSGLFSGNGKESGSETGDIVQTIKKAKKIIAIISAISPVLFPIILGILVVVIVMAQIMTIRDNITQLVQQFTTGVEKLINFAQGDGWMTNEDSFFHYLDEEYRKFSYTVSSISEQLDIPLIAATIHYSKTVDVEQYEEKQGNGSSEYRTDDFEQLGGALTKDQTLSFYKVAKDKLGHINTLLPGQKRLLGHMVKTELDIVWVDWDAAGTYYMQFGNYLAQTISETASDIHWKTNLKFTSIFGFIDTYNTIKDYYDQNKDLLSGAKYDFANVVYEAGEFINSFGALFQSATGKAENQEGNLVPLEDQNSWLKFPAPVLKRTMNYGHKEYKQMKQDMIDIKGIMNQNGIDTSTYTRKQVEKYAASSTDSELQNLYKSYKANQDAYEYSYTHYLQNVYIPFTYFYGKTYNLSEVDAIVDDIYDQRDYYRYLIGEDFDYNCGGSCVYQVDNQMVENLKVRLLQCGDEKRGQPIMGEDLVDFEKYILGVVYAEIGPNAPAEAAKTQAIAARSYALTRAKTMGNSAGLKLEKENDNWVLSIRNCTEDQVYCDPDKGCSTAQPADPHKGITMYSGSSTKAYTYKGRLPEDASIRSAISEVVGKVLLDSKGEIIVTDYTDVNQRKWISNANNGMDYTQILIDDYATASTLSNPSCSKVCNAATGDYTQWKQWGAPWSNIVIGSGQTIGNVGCLVTSVSMQIARSKVPLTIPELNPGTFVEALKPDGFDGANFYWTQTIKVAPTFQLSNIISLNGLTTSAKALQIQNLINQGCYLVMEVKSACGNGQHWVAVDYVQGSTVYMMDPATTQTNWEYYDSNCAGEVVCYKVIG